MINITHVSKSFKQQCILNSVNLSIQTGETIYIKGANGSGKSTLLKIIAGLLEPDTGMIEGTADLNIGALIENPSFIEDRPLLDNLKFLYTLKNKFNHDAIKKYCDYFELDLNSKKKMRSYSIGMRQKAGIIQAIMENQDLILFDEPTRGLDQESAQKFIELVHNDLKERTVIISAHEGVDRIQFDWKFALINGTLQSI